MRTSLDLELDLQASLTRQSRLNDELQALRGLRQKLEELKAQGETDLPPGVLEDERFQKLLKQAEKQVQGSRSPHPPGGASAAAPLGLGSTLDEVPNLGIFPSFYYPTTVVSAVVVAVPQLPTIAP